MMPRWKHRAALLAAVGLCTLLAACGSKTSEPALPPQVTASKINDDPNMSPRMKQQALESVHNAQSSGSANTH